MRISASTGTCFITLCAQKQGGKFNYAVRKLVTLLEQYLPCPLRP